METVQSGEQLTAHDADCAMGLWQPQELLDLADIVRKYVGKGLQLESDTMKKLKDALDYIVKGEISGNPLEFEHIVFSRFEKVIEAIISRQLGTSAEPVLLNQVLSRAVKIHWFWQERLAADLPMIEGERAGHLMSTLGRLAFVVLNDEKSTEVGRPVWFATRRVPGAGFGIRQVELGQ